MLPQFKPHSSANQERAHFAKTLVRLLRERDMNQSELSRRVGLSRDAISSYVRARSMPEPTNLRAIADVLGVKTTDMTLPAEHDATLVNMPLLMDDAASEHVSNAVQLMMREGGRAQIVIRAELALDKALELVRLYDKTINAASN